MIFKLPLPASKTRTIGSRNIELHSMQLRISGHVPKDIAQFSTTSSISSFRCGAESHSVRFKPFGIELGQQCTASFAMNDPFGLVQTR